MKTYALGFLVVGFLLLPHCISEGGERTESLPSIHLGAYKFDLFRCIDGNLFIRHSDDIWKAVLVMNDKYNTVNQPCTGYIPSARPDRAILQMDEEDNGVECAHHLKDGRILYWKEPGEKCHSFIR